MDIDGLATFQQVHAVLTGAAKNKQPITYSDAMKAIGWGHVHTYQRNVFAYVLKAVAYAELGAGNPPLTAIVVSKDHGLPNPSFFEFARAEARLRKDETEGDYWKREIARVYDHWK